MVARSNQSTALHAISLLGVAIHRQPFSFAASENSARAKSQEISACRALTPQPIHNRQHHLLPTPQLRISDEQDGCLPQLSRESQESRAKLTPWRLGETLLHSQKRSARRRGQRDVQLESVSHLHFQRHLREKTPHPEQTLERQCHRARWGAADCGHCCQTSL